MLRRVRKVGRKTVRRGLVNIRLLRLEAYYATTYLVPPESVACYYIFFPDPWPKKRHHENRLFNERFMNALARTLKPGGTVHFATDHLPYFEEVRQIVQADGRFEAAAIPFEPSDDERTDFELYFMREKPIGRLSFQRAARRA